MKVCRSWCTELPLLATRPYSAVPTVSERASNVERIRAFPFYLPISDHLRCLYVHHACYENGGGFCTFNGLMVAALALHASGEVKRVGIIDFDLHYSNGTDDIISLLQIDWITHYSAGGSLQSRKNAASLLSSIPRIVKKMRDCDVIMYQAGADPQINDPMHEWLTTEQLLERDRLVFQSAHALGIPVAWDLAGGYQSPLRKVLDIHDNTMIACGAEYLLRGASA